MGCCFSSGAKKETKKGDSLDEEFALPVNDNAAKPIPGNLPKLHAPAPEPAPTTTAHKADEGDAIDAKPFTFRELATATKNFRPESLLGEGGFGRVYKGFLEKNGLQPGQFVAVKQLDRNGIQGTKEFLAEVSMLSRLHHPNLVNLVGYCADGDQRLVVYEYMSFGTLEDLLHDFGPEKKPLNWFRRMKIAAGAAEGLEYLHEKAKPPVIYRDLKSSNILLDEECNPKLSDFGLVNLMGDKGLVSPRVMGTYGYCAPEYSRTGELTLKSDVYSFGVVLLELITGRRAMDTTRPMEEQNLVTWAQPMFRDQKRYPELADPLLKGEFPVSGLNQAVAISAMCLQEEPSVRPLISDVVAALSFLSAASPMASPPNTVPPAPNKEQDDESDEERHRAVSKASETGSSSRQHKSQSEYGSSEDSDGESSDGEGHGSGDERD